MKSKQTRATDRLGLAILVLGILGLFGGLAVPPAEAATELETIMVSPDTTTTFGTLTIQDQGVLADDLSGMRVPISLGSLPEEVAVDALHDPGDGTYLFSIDTWADLAGLEATPADVLMWDGSVYSQVFDATMAGVPAGVNVDAITVIDGELAISFDIGVELPGGPFLDGDLMIWDGTTFWLVFSASGAGVPSQIGLDGVHRLDNGHFLLSFDVGGSVAGLPFADEDILEHDPGAASWELAFDGSVAHPSWVAADLDALSVGERREILEIPTLSTVALCTLALFLALAGARLARRRGVLDPLS